MVLSSGHVQCEFALSVKRTYNYDVSDDSSEKVMPF